MLIKFELPAISLSGDGTSLWGRSRGNFVINRGTISYFQEKGETTYGHLQLFGINTDWWQYTDRLIEKKVNEIIIPIIEKKVPFKIKSVGWSEQGMQPSKGWDFDVEYLEKKNKKKINTDTTGAKQIANLSRYLKGKEIIFADNKSANCLFLALRDIKTGLESSILIDTEAMGGGIYGPVGYRLRKSKTFTIG